MPAEPPVTTVPLPPDPVWDCGVASGLHDATSSVLWTRVVPGASGAVDVSWDVATDPGFATVVASGVVGTDPDRDGCVKVLVGDLVPGTTHWYRFRLDGSVSPTGRTRTPAAAGIDPGRVRLAVASCQNYPSGYYTAWRDVAGLELDAVVHVGDYIYEGGGSVGPLNVRADTVGTATTLAQYRAKYRLYRSDPDLRAAHAAHAFVPVWDDHEFVNDYDRTTLIAQPERAAAAYRAWFEYQPVWPIDDTRIHRGVRFGSLVDLSVLDTRQYRGPHLEGGKGLLVLSTEEPGRRIHEVGRTILGDDQRSWFLDRLGSAQDDGVTWKLVGNQVMIAPVRILDLDEPAVRFLDPELPEHAGIYINEDSWDGFQWERDQILGRLASDRVANVAFLTGDVHSFWQAGLRTDFDDESSPVVAQEFTCGSISSRGVDLGGGTAEPLAQLVAGTRPGFRYVDLARRGVGIVDCTATSARVEFRVSDTAFPTGGTRAGTTFDWVAGTQDLVMTPG
jgi:alkaline phosphatase D